MVQIIDNKIQVLDRSRRDLMCNTKNVVILSYFIFLSKISTQFDPVAQVCNLISSPPLFHCVELKLQLVVRVSGGTFGAPRDSNH